MLTGSQYQQTMLVKEKDIDIVVFGHSPGCILYSLITLQEIVFDFTVVPLTDISRVLDSQRYDPRALLLNKLYKGVILEDRTGIVQRIQEKVREIYGQVTFNTLQQYRQHVIYLQKFRKYFYNKFDKYPPVLQRALLNDWYTTITAAEAFKFVNYLHGPFQKLELLQDRAPEFLAEVEQVLDEARVRQNYQPVADYTNHYTTTRKVSQRPVPAPGALLTVDLEYDDFTLSHFVLTVLPVLRSDPGLGAAYRHCYLTPAKYYGKYSYQLCVTFQPDKGGIRYYALPGKLRALLTDQKTVNNLKMAVVPEDEVHKPGYASLEELRGILSAAVAGFIGETGGFHAIPVTQMAFRCLDMLRSNLPLQREDIEKANSFLWQNWAFTSGKIIRTTQLGTIKTRYEQSVREAAEYYDKHFSAYLPSIIESGFYQLPNGWDGLEASITRIIAELLDSAGEVEADLRYHALIPFSLTRPDAAYWYIVLAEEIFTSLNLAYKDRLFALYAFFKVEPIPTTT